MIYIKPIINREEKTFFAVKYENKTYPLYDQQNIKETFIYGKGYIKVGKRCLLTVPYIEEINTTTWKEYLYMYGENCLYYSLTGKILSDQDCCESTKRNEFLSIVWNNIDIEKYEQFCALFDKFHAIQEKVLKYIGIYDFLLKDFYIYPSYKIASFFITRPTFDVVLHDGILWKTYIEKLDNDFKKEGESTQEYIDMIHNLREDKCDFPICMKDRITYLFGKEAANIYEQMLTFFD